MFNKGKPQGSSEWRKPSFKPSSLKNPVLDFLQIFLNSFSTHIDYDKTGLGPSKISYSSEQVRFRNELPF
ncbi:hypothetical protein BpHYR1_026142 [Brachionus plicatilis]|uniref:Uncharacterized protein n=1 Tax=Brachionus plicatilis TaxID=10195 RepID=A0A3M7T753_BRAPC|nr:hypothetical protein BpHYR1_026142 [Brachionus plicatilis]